MTSIASARHAALETLLIEGRQQGTLTEQEDDFISEEMADLWYQMDDLERREARDRIAPYAKSLVDKKASLGSIALAAANYSSAVLLDFERQFILLTQEMNPLSNLNIIISLTNKMMPIIQSNPVTKSASSDYTLVEKCS